MKQQCLARGRVASYGLASTKVYLVTNNNTGHELEVEALGLKDALFSIAGWVPTRLKGQRLHSRDWNAIELYHHERGE